MTLMETNSILVDYSSSSSNYMRVEFEQLSFQTRCKQYAIIIIVFIATATVMLTYFERYSL